MDEYDNLEQIFGYILRKNVSHQDGRNTNAPSVLFADADFEVGDGVCGIHADSKQANESAIVYTRADALVNIFNQLKDTEKLLQQSLLREKRLKDTTNELRELQHQYNSLLAEKSGLHDKERFIARNARKE